MNFFIWILSLLGFRRKQKRESFYTAEAEKKHREILSRIEKREKERNQKVRDSLHLLTGSGWKDPQGKKEFVEAVYEGRLPEYLWYEVASVRATEEEIRNICKLFWGDEGPGWGDIERHHALRIRNPKHFATEITFGGQKCPLRQVGYLNMGMSEGGPCFLFETLYNEKQLADAKA